MSIVVFLLFLDNPSMQTLFRDSLNLLNGAEKQPDKITYASLIIYTLHLLHYFPCAQKCFAR